MKCINKFNLTHIACLNFLAPTYRCVLFQGRKFQESTTAPWLQNPIQNNKWCASSIFTQVTRCTLNWDQNINYSLTQNFHLKFKLKRCVPIILLRNIIHPTLYSDTQLAVKKLMKNVVKATILTEPFEDKNATTKEWQGITNFQQKQSVQLATEESVIQTASNYDAKCYS